MKLKDIYFQVYLQSYIHINMLLNKKVNILTKKWVKEMECHTIIF